MKAYKCPKCGYLIPTMKRLFEPSCCFNHDCDFTPLGKEKFEIVEIIDWEKELLLKLKMKAKKVDCINCQNFKFNFFRINEKNKCTLGKRVMFRMPKFPDGECGWFRYCNDFKELTKTE